MDGCVASGYDSQFAMEAITMAMKIGKPSISIRAIYTMAMLVITRMYFFEWLQSLKETEVEATSNHTPESYPMKLCLSVIYPAFKTYIYSNQQ